MKINNFQRKYGTSQINSLIKREAISEVLVREKWLINIRDGSIIFRNVQQ